MKKILFILLFFVVLISFSLIGYQVVSANEVVDEIKDIIEEQNSIDTYFSSYGYTIDNPNIIVNPYGISPLTALILFETDEEVSVSITVEGKDQESSFINTFDASKKHYIPVYGLYANYENKVSITYKNVKKTYIIKTDKLPNDFKIDKIDCNSSLSFVNQGKYPYAIDKNHDVRWFLIKKYSGKIDRLQNGHFLLGNDVMILEQYSRDLLEIDLLGKIYYQYSIEDGYYGTYVEVGSSLFVLSDHLLEIDKQSGVILRELSLDKKYDSLSYNKDTNMLELQGEENLAIKKDNFEVATKNDISDRNEKVVSSSLYLNQSEYKIITGIRFSNSRKTIESNKKIFLVGYKKIDDDYLEHNIKIKKYTDYLQINGKFQTNDKIYVILDKFLDKKVYDMNNNQLIVNNYGLSGKYSIYIKINDVIYKTNYYVSF